MNMSKTKLMTNSTKKQIILNGKEIDYVNEYVYLGQIISPEDQTDKELEKRTTNAWRKFWSLKEVFKTKEIPTGQKFKVFNSCIIPIITYGCQTWGLTKKQHQKLNVCQNHMERSILNIKLRDRVKLSIIKEKSKTKTITKIIKQQKWRWTGHMMRENIDKWTKDLVEWCPRYNKRKSGPQKFRWSDDLSRIGGGKWMQTAKERNKWKEMEEAYVKGRVEVNVVKQN